MVLNGNVEKFFNTKSKKKKQIDFVVWQENRGWADVFPTPFSANRGVTVGANHHSPSTFAAPVLHGRGGMNNTGMANGRKRAQTGE
jgi:hypothetical protein